MHGAGNFGSRSPLEPPDWRDEPATQKQKDAIFNMTNALKMNYVEPTKKGEAADMIKELSQMMENMKDEWPDRDYDYGDEEY